MDYHAPSKCPVCGHEMEVTRLKCSHCDTELSGHFSPCRFCMLEDKYLEFIQVFLTCRGSIKEVEKALGVSYPTVRNMMDASLAALGLDKKQGEEEQENIQRDMIFEKLSQGEIDVNEAVEELNKLKGEKNHE